MCLQWHTQQPAKTDLLDRSIVYNNYSMFDDNCDYLTTEKWLLIDNTDFAIVQLNIRGLGGKVDKLKTLLNDSFKNKQPDAILLCETWLSKNSPEIVLPGYCKYEYRRTHKKGGGVCIYIADQHLSRERPDCCCENAIFEHCIAEIKLKDRKLLVGKLYCAPNSNQSEFLKGYKDLIGKLKSTNYDVILGMDHNLDFLKSHLHENTQGFINYNLDNDLFPVITRPTRITHSSATLIDNVLLGSRHTGQTTSRIIVDDISDHLPCVTIIENLLPTKSNKREITSRDVRQKNLNILNEELAVLILKLQPSTDINSQFNDFHEVLQTTIQNHCPVVTRKVAKSKFRREPWMTHGLLYKQSETKNPVSSNPEK